MPASPAAREPLDATAALAGIAQLADQPRLLAQQASCAARSADPLALAEVPERMLPLRAGHARRYRPLLARRASHVMTGDSVSC